MTATCHINWEVCAYFFLPIFYILKYIDYAICIIFLAVLGFELRTLCLLGMHTSSSFYFSYFSGRVLCFCPGPMPDGDLPTYGPTSSWVDVQLIG
jgi:hypothetical protein